jgi:hypothetical protein
MSLRAVRDFLSALYASKARSDARPGAPWETLESHLYSFLRHTVGLRSLMATQARAFLSAVARYARIDNDCLVAQRILRSECDEEFRRGAFSAVAEGAAETLRVVLKNTMPASSAAAITAALVARGVGVRAGSDSNLPLPGHEWRALPAALFADKSDAAEAMAALESAALRCAAAAALGIELGYRESPLALQLADGSDVDAAVSATETVGKAVATLSPAEAAALLTREGAGSLAWPTIIHELQLLAIERHARFLRAFIAIWRKIDVERTGSMSASRFVELIDSVSPSASSAARSLAIEAAARGGCDITFSAAVAALAGSGSGSGSGARGPPPESSALGPPVEADGTPVPAGPEESSVDPRTCRPSTVELYINAAESASSAPPASPPLKRAPQLRAQRASLLQPTAVTAEEIAPSSSHFVIKSKVGKVNYAK